LTRDVGDEPKKLKRVESIRGAAERAAAFTRQLMSLSRGHELEPRVVDVDAALRALQPTLRGAIGEQVEIVLSLNFGARVLIDPAQFDQVVMTLALNARDTLAAGGTLTIHTAERSGLLLTISDNGPGIPSQMLPHVFEPFFSTKAKGKGPGLALATAYSIVGQSGGKLLVESEPGRGTTFSLLLPVVAAPAEPKASVPAPTVVVPV